MEHEALLLGITQVAVTLAGFSGLVVAIRGASPEAWHARDIWSLTWMFGSSFGGLFLALLPLLLGAFHVREELIWRSGDLVMFVFVIGFSVAMAVWGHRLTKSGHPPRVRFFPASARVLLVCCGVLSGAQACGLFPNARAGFFILGLTGCLFVAALSLVVFLIVLARAAARHHRARKSAARLS